MEFWRRARWTVTAALALSLSAGLAVAQQDRLDEQRKVPASIEQLRLPTPLRAVRTTLEPSLAVARGEQQVIVRLKTPSVGDVDRVPDAEVGYDRDGARVARRLEIDAEQDAFLGRILSLAPGARVVAQTRLVLNAVFLEVDAASLGAIAKDPAVMRVAPVGDYKVLLSETVPYIGAAFVHRLGIDGRGVRVAILDSGVDYYHAHLGGSGDPNDFLNDDPTTIEPGTFPTSKVVDGADFVGSVWPAGDLAPDDDPIDDGPGGGHGTHVADIAGGLGGVAPGADLYAVKVCSSVSTSCSGIALIQGMEFAVDPNGDLDPRDHVDIVNMSLGADYGQPFDDDLSAAVDNATALGVLTVAAAGNGGDKPYVQGTPAGAKTALSVAQTAVPSAFLPQMELTAPDEIAGLYTAVHQSWSAPLTGVIEGPVQYGDDGGVNLDGCAPFVGSLTGKIVLVDRGTCNFTLKIKNIGDAGGEIGIIGLITPDAPFNGGDGGDRPIIIPGYMISQDDSNAIKSGLPDTMARFDPSVGIELVGSVIGSSSRGPQMDDNRIKPEIAAPGASVSAVAGTGTGESSFGGTSGASPMVAGSAALLMDAFPHRGPLEIKAALMNTGETDIINDVLVGDLAPISRIGGGEVRVDRALRAQAAAWDDTDRGGHCHHHGHFHRAGVAGALSFGFHDVAHRRVRLTRTVRVKNYSWWPMIYKVTPTFRFDDDVATGAVKVDAPRWLWVPRRGSRTFEVTMTIDGRRLRGNYMNSGSQGANPAVLTLNEYDGYLELEPIWRWKQPIHVAWHVLPRQAAKVKARPHRLPSGDFSEEPFNVGLFNKGVGTAQNDGYSLLALSENLPEGDRGQQSPTPDIRAVGVQTYLDPGCEAQFIWAFAINTWERQTHLIPVSHQVWLDTDQDGTSDWVVLNRDGSFNNITEGPQLSWALDQSTGNATAFFYADHATNTNNTVLYVCGEQLGLSSVDILATNVDAFVVAQDFYYGGPDDTVDDITITPYGERYYANTEDMPGGTRFDMPVDDFGPLPGNSPELGLMLFTNGDRGTGAHGGATEKTEALLIPKRGVPVPRKKP